MCEQPFPDDSFDVVTMPEVLEHSPQVDHAIMAAVRMARRHVAVSVPSRPDDNPEHIHLLTRVRLTGLFGAAGCSRLNFDGVEGDVMAHTRMVCEWLVGSDGFRGASRARMVALLLAALLHDVGKTRTTREVDDRWTSPQHAASGAGGCRIGRPCRLFGSQRHPLRRNHKRQRALC